MTVRSSLRTVVAMVVAAGVGFVGVPVAAAAATVPDAEPPALWTPVPEGGERSLPVPAAASETFVLDIAAMTRALVPVSSRRSLGGDASGQAVISVPTPTGELVRFAVTPVAVLADSVQQANPQIRTVAGRGIDDAGLTIRADVTPLGFHAMVRSADGRTKAWFVDPVTVGDDSRHVSYAAGASELPRLDEPEPSGDDGTAVPPAAEADNPGGTVGLRTVRLALANDPSFASFYGTENVLAAKASMVNRVAGVFNDDLGVRLLLAEGTDRLNFDTDAAAVEPNGPCGAEACFAPEALRGCEVETLRQNSAAVQGIVGNDAYDVGHIVLGSGGGGIAGYGEVGLDFVKGGGCTGSSSPVGDAFAIDYLAHEIGHQLGASHTFNACGGGSGATAVEPGSGSTIMAYAGLCGDNDLQKHSDPYLSHTSIDEIHRTLDERLPAADSTNTPPVVTAPVSKTIPIRTPFTLTATATDAEGPVFLLWEQSDVGDDARALFDDVKVAGPLFRVFGTRAEITAPDASMYFSPGRNLATGDVSRTFPDMAQILRGNTNAATGSCDASASFSDRVDCASEFLPGAAYGGDGPASLNFRVTARDVDPRGGGVAGADVRLDLDRTAGPLLVRGLDEAPDGYVAGSTQTVRWAVNGTDAADLAPRVRISMTDATGEGVDRVLLADTANDGSARIVLPDAPLNGARVRIDAVDNYFFAVSPTAVDIAAAPTPTPTPTPTPGPTLTRDPGPTPTTTPTLEPTPTPEPTPTRTPGPDATPTPQPTATSAPSATPTAGPGATPMPGATPTSAAVLSPPSGTGGSGLSVGPPPSPRSDAPLQRASLARTGAPDPAAVAGLGLGAILAGAVAAPLIRRQLRRRS